MSLRIFLPIEKVDAAHRLVYGTFTEEAGDRSGEIMDYDTSKPNFEKWSNELYGTSGGKNYGNVRAMHKAIAAGHFNQPIEFDDASRKMSAVAWVTDNEEWAKVEAGTYTGFSVGGRYGKRWIDPKNPSLIRYTAIPSEVSLVDLPCVSGATFQFVKAEGAQPEDRPFTSVGLPEEPPPPLTEAPTPNTIEKRAGEPKAPEHSDETGNAVDSTKQKTDGAGDSKDKINAEQDKEKTTPKVDPGHDNKDNEAGDKSGAAGHSGDTRTHQMGKTDNVEKAGGEEVPELEQVWKSKDGTTFAKKADAVKHNQELDTNVAVKAHIGPLQDALGKLDTLLGGTPEDPESLEKAGDGKEPFGGKKAPPFGADSKDSKGADEKDSKSADKKDTPNPSKKKTPAEEEEELAEKLHKDLYDVGRVASIVSELKYIRQNILVEQSLEGDTNSKLPEGVQKACDALCAFLLDMVKEEVSEIMSGTDVQVSGDTRIAVIANAAGVMRSDLRKSLLEVEGVHAGLAEVLNKVGAKMSGEAMMHLQSAHDHISAMTDGEACSDGSMDKLAQADRARVKTVHDHMGALGASCSSAKLDLSSSLNKSLMGLGDADLRLDNSELPPAVAKLLAKSNGLEFQLGKMTSTVNTLLERVEKLAAQPEPPKGVFRVLTKEQDSKTGGGGTVHKSDEEVVAAFQEYLSKMDPDQQAREMIKLSLANPVLQVD